LASEPVRYFTLDCSPIRPQVARRWWCCKKGARDRQGRLHS